MVTPRLGRTLYDFHHGVLRQAQVAADQAVAEPLAVQLHDAPGPLSPLPTTSSDQSRPHELYRDGASATGPLAAVLAQCPKSYLVTNGRLLVSKHVIMLQFD